MSNFNETTSDQTSLRTQINTSKGDILVASDTTSPASASIVSHFHPVNVGTNGQVLTADSTQQYGVKWASGTSGPASSISPGANINGVLFTGASNITVPAAAGTLTGTTLAANVVASSLTSVGILTAPQLQSYAKASLPSAVAAGQVIYVSDATGLHKTGSVAFSIATGTGSWVDVTTGNFVA